MENVFLERLPRTSSWLKQYIHFYPGLNSSWPQDLILLTKPLPSLVSPITVGFPAIPLAQPYTSSWPTLHVVLSSPVLPSYSRSCHFPLVMLFHFITSGRALSSTDLSAGSRLACPACPALRCQRDLSHNLISASLDSRIYHLSENYCLTPSHLCPKHTLESPHQAGPIFCRFDMMTPPQFTLQNCVIMLQGKNAKGLNNVLGKLNICVGPNS